MYRFVLFVLFLAFASICGATKDETADEMKVRFETARAEDRAELAIRIAQKQTSAADKLYNDGKVDLANMAVDDVVSYSEKARDAATETKKHLKEIEIDVRKMAQKLRDIKRTVAFDDQPPIDGAVQRLENVRTDLLKAMFAKDKKKSSNFNFKESQ